MTEMATQLIDRRQAESGLHAGIAATMLGLGSQDFAIRRTRHRQRDSACGPQSWFTS
jgi:hypothetical protein